MVRLFKQHRATERFAVLIEPHVPTVLRLASILCGGHTAESEDLAQETLLKAFKSIDQFQDGTNAKAWLMRILRNTRIDRLRTSSAHPSQSLCELPADPEASSKEVASAWNDPQDILNCFSDHHMIEALQRLPEEIRWTLLLVDVEQLDHREAAVILAVPAGTIKSRAHRGRAMLREALLPLARELRLVS